MCTFPAFRAYFGHCSVQFCRLHCRSVHIPCYSCILRTCYGSQAVSKLPGGHLPRSSRRQSDCQLYHYLQQKNSANCRYCATTSLLVWPLSGAGNRRGRYTTISNKKNSANCRYCATTSLLVWPLSGAGNRRGRYTTISNKKTRRLSRVFFVEIVGVEPTTLCLQSRCSSQLSYTPLLFEKITSNIFEVIW